MDAQHKGRGGPGQGWLRDPPSHFSSPCHVAGVDDAPWLRQRRTGMGRGCERAPGLTAGVCTRKPSRVILVDRSINGLSDRHPSACR